MEEKTLTKRGGDFFAQLTMIAVPICETVDRKNHDYGGSFDALLDEYGPVGFLVRLGDKYHRLKALLGEGQEPLVNEAVEDTVKDIIGYCLLYLRYVGRERKV